MTKPYFTIRTIKGATIGPVHVLCDREGNVVPGQRNTALASGVDELTTFTVTFNVEGEDISLDVSTTHQAEMDAAAEVLKREDGNKFAAGSRVAQAIVKAGS